MLVSSWKTYKIIMVVVECSVPGCESKSSDVAEPLAIALLGNHILPQQSTVLVQSTLAVLRSPKIDEGVYIEYWNVFLQRWEVFPKGVGIDEACRGTMALVSQHTPANVPLHWKERVYEDLLRNNSPGVFESVPYGEPVTWCHHMVITRKHDGSLRHTVDLSPLNSFANRKHSPWSLLSISLLGSRRTRGKWSQTPEMDIANQITTARFLVLRWWSLNTKNAVTTTWSTTIATLSSTSGGQSISSPASAVQVSF